MPTVFSAILSIVLANASIIGSRQEAYSFAKNVFKCDLLSEY